tara:strand:- start:2181 stop:3122 length:942 start_codon:yes stop_codon:yes gene_type:complete
MNINGILTINNTLKSRFWGAGVLDSNISSALIKVATDFFEDLSLEGADLDDITFTGSLANYNWTKFSDVDLHLLVDFSKIDENYDLVREFFSAKTSNWNKHHSITVFGHEIEIYVQDLTEKHHSSGVYSIKNNRWLTKPERIEPDINVPAIKNKIISFVDMIERAEDLLDDKNYEDAHKFSLKLVKKIKNYRQSGLEERGEYSNENLVFKNLRNTGQLQTLYAARNKSYDNMMSVEGDFNKKFKIFISSDDFEEKQGFHRLEEIGKYQKRIKKRHVRMKKRLISLGKQKNVGPYTRKPSYRRSKSSPAGHGGV